MAWVKHTNSTLCDLITEKNKTCNPVEWMRELILDYHNTRFSLMVIVTMA